MAFDKDFWKNLYFSENNKPSIICPTCRKGLLQIWNDSFKIKDSAHTQHNRDNEDWDMQQTVRVFSGILHCNNKDCGEYVSVSGEELIEPEYISEHEQGLVNQKFPKFFVPSLEIFKIKEQYPNEVQKQLRASFKMFFCDTASSANKIRNCVEVLMNEARISTTRTTKKGKAIGISLDERLDEYSTTNPVIAARLRAIKWIGNSGSHLDSLNIDDLLDAYEILLNVLDKLFDDHEKYIQEKVERINTHKKPLSKTIKKIYTTKGIKE